MDPVTVAEPRRAPPVVASAGAWPGLQRRRRVLVGSLSIAVFLIAWEVVGSRTPVSRDLISHPTKVLSVGATMVASGELGYHALVSLQEFVYGFAPAVGLGLLIGLAVGQSRRFRYLCEPLLMALYTAPRIALIPVLVIWLGVGMASKVAAVFLGGLLPILVNTAAGVQQLDPLWVRAVRAYGATRLQLLIKVTLPGSLPAVMAGIRLGLGRAIIGLVVGEMYVSLAGIGRLVQDYGQAGRTAELVVLVSLIALFGFLLIQLVRRVETWLGSWPREIEV